MAITFTAVSDLGAANEPSGFTNPTAASLTSPFELKDNVNIDVAASGVADADAATGLDNILAALVTYAEGTLSTALKLDSSETITGNIYLKSVVRVTDGASIYNTGTDEYQCVCRVEWE